MIYLCSDNNKVQEVINKGIGTACIRNIINLYLLSYGIDYDFAQFYIQESYEGSTATALLFRYNQTVYLVSDSDCDTEELIAFIQGFTDVTLISDRTFPIETKGEICAVMNKQGEKTDVQYSDVKSCNEPKAVAALVCENMPENRRTDFFLNTAYQMRHGLLSVFSYIKDSALVSVASVFKSDTKEAVIPFVYTGEYFRGNGYSKAVLDVLCSDSDVSYQLLCEEHNVIFYEKCGFSRVSTWYKYCL